MKLVIYFADAACECPNSTQCYICILTDFVILTNDSFLSLPYRTMAMMIDLQWLSHKVIMRYFICFIYLVCMHVFRPLLWLSLFKNCILQDPNLLSICTLFLSLKFRVWKQDYFLVWTGFLQATQAAKIQFVID